MPNIDERDALNVKKSLSPLSDTDKLKLQRYELAQKVASNEPSGLLNKKLPNLRLFGDR
jgi:hypothetical protein